MKSIKAMEKALQSQKASKQERLELHFHLAVFYLGNNPEKCIEHSNHVLQIQPDNHQSEDKINLIKKIQSMSESGIDPIEKGKIYLGTGDLYRRNQLDTAYYYYEKALETFTELKLPDMIAESYSKLSYVYNKKGEYKKSEIVLEKALKLAKETRNLRILSKCYSQYGEIRYYQGAFEETLEYYLKSLKLDEESGEIREISKGYNNIGTVYYRIRDYEKAEEYFSRALEMKLKLPDKSGLAYSYNNLGALNFILKRYEKSLEQYQKSYSIREKLNDIKGQAATCCNIGGVHFELKNINEALKCFEKSYKLSLKIDDKHNAALVSGNIANAYKELGDLTQAVKSAENQFNLANELEEKPLQNSACRTLSAIYEKMQDFHKALEYYKQYKYLSEDIYYNDSEKKIFELKSKYDIEKKERIAEIHRLKNVELVKANELIQKKNTELQAYKEELLLINKILSHDIANDLSVIQNAMELYRESPEETMLDEIEKRTENSIRTIREQRHLVSVLDLTERYKTYPLEKVFDGLDSSHEQVIIKINGAGNVYADEAIHSVFENLINNAIIHGKATMINIDVIPKNFFYEIRFADNGRGIPKQVRPKIFQEGYSYGENGNTGIGLHIVKETIERYGGTITVEEKKPHGTVFVITLRKAE